MNMQTTAPDEVKQASHELRVVLGRLTRRLRAEGTLPLRYGTVLTRIDREGPLGTSDLAQRERMRPQSMAETVQELEAAGLVERSDDPSDGRRRLVMLTPEGKKTLRADWARREDWLAEAIVDRLSRREQEALVRAIALLERLADGADRQAGRTASFRPDGSTRVSSMSQRSPSGDAAPW